MAAIFGVWNILTTPFLPDGKLDEASLERLVEATIAAGVDGLTILGVAGEAHKLSQRERSRVQRVVAGVARGRAPLAVGTSAEGTDNAIGHSRAAERAGAVAVMVAPPTFLAAGPALTEHYRRVADSIGIPLILQDFPPVNGVILSPGQIAELVAAVPQIACIKLEGLPTPLRTGQVLALVGGSAVVVGGSGGLYLLDELRRGASGVMTGFSYPEGLVQIWRAWQAGDRRAAAQAYHRWLPLLLFEGQPGIGLAVRKEVLRRRGLIDHATVRQPGPTLPAGIAEDLTETIELLDLAIT